MLHNSLTTPPQLMPTLVIIDHTLIVPQIEEILESIGHARIARRKMS